MKLHQFFWFVCMLVWISVLLVMLNRTVERIEKIITVKSVQVSQ